MFWALPSFGVDLFFSTTIEPPVKTAKHDSLKRVIADEVVLIGSSRSASNQVSVDTSVLLSSKHLSLGDMLQQNSNINIRNYGRGAKQYASLRGTGATHTKVIWNGIEVNSPLDGSVDLSLIPMQLVESVSVTPSQDAIGGRLNIESLPDFSKKTGISANLGLGSFSSVDAAINGRLTFGRFQSVTKVFYNYSKNDFEFINRDIIDPSRPGWHPTQRNNNAEYWNFGAMEELYFRLTDNSILSAIVWGGISDRNLPQLTTYEGSQNNNLTNSKDRNLRAIINYKLYGKHLELLARLKGDIQDTKFDQQNRTVNGYEYVINSSGFSRSFAGDVELRFLLGRHTLVSLTEGRVNQAVSHELIKDLGFSKSRFEASESVSLISSWGKRWKTEARLKGGFVGSNGYLNPLIAGEFNVAKWLTLRAQLSYNTQYPSLGDLYFTPGGNPNLRPEKALTAEIGGNFKVGGVVVDLNLYSSQVDDWIIWLPSHQQYWSPQNVRQVKAMGVELHVKKEWKLGDWTIDVVGNGSINRTINSGQKINENDMAIGNQLAYVPLFSGGLFAQVDWKGVYLNYRIYGESEKYASTSANPTSLSTIEAYVLNDIGVGYTYKFIKGELLCKNFLNSRFNGILRRPMAPISLEIRLQVTF